MDSEAGEKQYGDAYSFTDHYTPESYLKNETKTTVSGTVDGYFYAINVPEEMGIPSPTVENTREYNMLFNNIDYVGVGEVNGPPYWLASRGVYADSDGALFGPGAVLSEDGLTYVFSGIYLFYSYGDGNFDGLAVRPVVVLKSNITSEQVSKTDQTEEEATWSYTSNPNAEPSAE